MKFKNAILLLGLFSLGIAFNNFSLTKPSPRNFQLNAAQSFDEKIRSLVKSRRNSISPYDCESSRNYSCLEKKFSLEKRTKEIQSLPCVKLLQGGEICPEGKSIFFDTRTAQENCGSDCRENYEFTEYSCHLKLQRPGEDLYPLVVTEDLLSEAIEKLHQACLQVKSEGSQ